MIPIKNIYWMLCYAFNSLKHKDYEKLKNEDFNNIYDLLTRILVMGVNSQIKRGLHREYIDETDELPSVKGKINISHSIKSQTFIKKRLVCEYDDFSYNCLMNKVIKATLFCLLKCDRLDVSLKKDVKKLTLFFGNIDDICLKNVVWESFRFNRNNASYKIILDVCYLIFKGLIINEQSGNVKFATFIEDKQMASLYEKFVLNFYNVECSNEVKAKAEYIDWMLDDEERLDLLPKMKTDISLYNIKGTKQLIIDTKFYPNALQTNFDHKTFISGNLYQIFSYVKNSAFEGEKSGMLLYPTVKYDLNKMASMSGNTIYVRTLNLDSDFEDIKKQLFEIKDLVI